MSRWAYFTCPALIKNAFKTIYDAILSLFICCFKAKTRDFYWLSNLAKVEVINDAENRCKSIWKSKNRGLEAEKKRCGSISGEVILVGLFEFVSSFTLFSQLVLGPKPVPLHLSSQIFNFFLCQFSGALI